MRESIKLAWFFVVAIAAWFFLSIDPLDTALPIGYYNNKRIVQVALVCVIVSFFCLRIFRCTLFALSREQGLSRPWGVSLVFILASTLLSANPVHSGLETLHWVLLIGLFTAGVFVARAGLSETLLALLLVAHGLLVFKAMLNLAFELCGGVGLRPELILPSVDNIRFFNQVQAFIIPLLLVALRSPKFGRFAALFLFLNFLLMLVSGVRGLPLSLMIVGIAGWILLPRLRSNFHYTLLLFVSAFVSYLLIRVSYPESHLHNDIFRTHSSGRVMIWGELIESLSWSHLVLGSGSGSYSYSDFERIEGHPHNSILQFVFEWGGIATIALCVAVLRVLFQAWKSIQNNLHEVPTIAREGVLIAAAVSALYSLFSGLVVMPVPQTLIFLYMGLLWGGRIDAWEVHNRRRLSYRSLVSYPLIFLTLLTYVTLFSAYFVQQGSDPDAKRGPRLWVEGEQFQEFDQIKLLALP
ncbi:hypothetical protein Maes01_00461 [Microbulbifer aestuariivivens]|uniref:O-antigen ligase-related domain-containing protein n=1 Tax=Microbulbifer aestuariivivens TaxID=1908308 RepID=A0ABP9WL30_9GAMM